MNERYLKMLKAMLSGSVTSIEVFFLTLLFSLPFALIIASGRMSKNRLVSGTTNIFLLVIRGTPLMLQLLVVYFGPGLFFKYLKELGYNIDLKWERFPAAITAMVINYSAYFAEIYRGGIESISKGQYEAGKVLGFTSRQTFFRIVVPQVIKRIVPAMGNEVITLVKDTALVSVIGVGELLLVAGVFYFVMNAVVSFAFIKLEKKLSYYS